nr:MAG TPA: hypothetical protein [Caudoviricetes sp.]
MEGLSLHHIYFFIIYSNYVKESRIYLKEVIL